ncbi:MAG: hypothetical protein ACJ8AT_35560 [Hyalangium sp.]|uniref:hypothetical protein n=1 Tax=Hyalangium sp. TaxID=2028555 RepID=UPI00389B33E0
MSHQKRLAQHYMEWVANELCRAAAGYRGAWRAQAAAEEIAGRAQKLTQDAYGDEKPPHVAQALQALNAATEQAQLLTIDLDLETLRELEKGAQQLEAVAQAAHAVAEALAKEGVLQ